MDAFAEHVAKQATLVAICQRVLETVEDWTLGWGDEHAKARVEFCGCGEEVLFAARFTEAHDPAEPIFLEHGGDPLYALPPDQGWGFAPIVAWRLSLGLVNRAA